MQKFLKTLNNKSSQLLLTTTCCYSNGRSMKRFNHSNYYRQRPILLKPSFNNNLKQYWNGSHLERIHSEELIYPLFVCDRPSVLEEIKGFPEQYRVGIDQIVNFVGPLVDKGLKSVILFGSVDTSKKDSIASSADADDSPVIQAIQLLTQKFPNLTIICDVCICAYTDSGECGIQHKINKEYQIDVNRSTSRLAEISLKYAQAGCHIVAPSDMLDNRIQKIDTILTQANLRGDVSIMSYAAKYSSSFYGPFRNACKSNFKEGQRRTNQLPPGSAGLGLRGIKRDIEEGADFIIVKPGMPYMDIIKHSIMEDKTSTPVIAYQVSGEYGMLYHGAKNGCFDLDAAVIESLTCFKRAGCSAIISYFTPYLLNKNLVTK